MQPQAHRSKYAALSNGKLPRLPLATGQELGLIAIALTVLLTLIFTSRNQFEQLLEQSTPDALSIAYLESLLHSEEDNLDLRLLLARARAEYVDYRDIEALLEPVNREGTPEQRRKAIQVQLRALIAAYYSGRRSLSSPDLDVLLHSLASENSSADELAFLADSALSLGRSDLAWELYLRLAREKPGEYRKLITPATIHTLATTYRSDRSAFSPPDIDVLLNTLVAEKNPAADLSTMADSALLIGRTDLAREFYQRIAKEEPKKYRDWVEPAAMRSLGMGHYRLAADLYFLAREGAEIIDARRLYARGVGALMASSRFTEAMDEAKRHLGDLADDAETLRFLIRTARAANNNPLAAEYARHLLGADASREEPTATGEDET